MRLWRLLQDFGVRQVALCPGSRNSPLLMTASPATGLTFTPHWDERGAAFWALGAAKAEGRPAAVCVTSGTAVAELYAAVVEAHQDGTPLIALTADRPAEMVGRGANQTIDQTRMFGAFAAFIDLRPPEEDPRDTDLDLLAKLLQTQCGPVQINQRFREPLTAPGAPLAFAPTQEDPGIRAPRRSRDRSLEKALGEELAAHARRRGDAAPLLLIGELRDPAEKAAAAALARVWQGPVHVDLLACRAELKDFGSLDRLLQNAGWRGRFRPRQMIHLGGRYLSKILDTAMAGLPLERLHLSSVPRPEPLDSLGLGGRAFILPWADLVQEAAEGAAEDAPSPWRNASAEVWKYAKRFHKTRPFREGSVPFWLREALPPKSLFLVGNSMAVRDHAAWFWNLGAEVDVMGFRGASGIDGQLAEALGAARALRRGAVAVLGDLTALHDQSSLALLAGHPHPFACVIINNQGGGIFHHLGVAETEGPFEAHVACAHPWTFEKLAAAFDLVYAEPADGPSLKTAVERVFEKKTRALIEVKTDRGQSVEEAKFLAAAVDRFLTERGG